MDDIRQREQVILRDEQELEGALLPAAVPILLADLESDECSPVSLAAATTGDFEPDAANDSGIQEALPIFSNVSGNDPRRDKELLRRADRRGAAEVELEKQTAQRERQRLYAIECATKEQIRRANERARELVRMEERGELEAPEAMMGRLAEERLLNSQQKSPGKAKAPELYEGTYGKEYEVKAYDTKAYETEEYNIGEYKSVYEPRK